MLASPPPPFPQFSLAQDPPRALRGLVATAFGSDDSQALPAVEVYDGDTPMGER